MKKNILLIGGSLNQTTMMHQIAQHLGANQCYFTPLFDDGWLGALSRQGLLEFSTLGQKHRKNTEAYLAKQGLPIDYGGQARKYDLIITGTDLLLPRCIQGKRLVLIQEGMMEPEGTVYHLVRTMNLPRYLANTSMTGLSHAYDLFCVASAGYRDLFERKGVKPEKMMVTGIPNFDNVEAFINNDFPNRGYVLAATSALRETFQWDHREAFIRKVQAIAQGRPIIFKLHPNENLTRARAEIKQIAPEAMIFESGSINFMIANCEVLVTQTSSVTYIGLALGKEIHSDLNLEDLRRLMPLQNGGTSAARIAELCELYLSHIPAPVVRNPVTPSFSRKAVDSV